MSPHRAFYATNIHNHRYSQSSFVCQCAEIRGDDYGVLTACNCRSTNYENTKVKEKFLKAIGRVGSIQSSSTVAWDSVPV